MMMRLPIHFAAQVYICLQPSNLVEVAQDMYAIRNPSGKSCPACKGVL